MTNLIQRFRKEGGSNLSAPRRALLAACLLLGACGNPPARPAASPPAQPAVSATATSQPAAQRQAPPPTAASHMIAAANPLAAETGRRILRAGGSAIDAAIAAQMVLTLVEPQSSGIGGGAFLMHFDAKTGSIQSFDGRETAPKSSTPDMFLKADGSKKSFYEAVVGGSAVGVPGLLRMLEAAHKQHGKLPWKELFKPAIEMAKNGFLISPRLAGLIADDKYLKTFDAPRRYFYDATGNPKPAGALLKNPELAATLTIIANGGADAFYTGLVANRIIDTVQEASLNPSGMAPEDLRSYQAKDRPPVCLPYRTWLVCGMGPPSSGGLTSLQILGILQHFDLGKMEPFSAQAVHLVAEASRLAFADRNTYMADSDFIPVPTLGLLDPAYLDLRAQEISPLKAGGNRVPGMPGVQAQLKFAPSPDETGLSTTHLSVIDKSGNGVSMTSSIENAFGSRLMTGGFMLNNQLTDFSFAPEIDGAPVANRVEAGKRPRSSMAPTLVFDGSGKLVMAVGSPGGSRIIGYVVKTLIAALDWGMDIDAAIDAPYFVNRNGTTDLEMGTALEALKPELEQMGHSVKLISSASGLHGIRVTESGLEGGADKRREGVALGD
ncbi:MAG: gamma-glutamyltransferase [Rhodospirillales bacterium]|nr:gamma-glutamyltransferase [Rhodospirillales bacterium]